MSKTKILSITFDGDDFEDVLGDAGAFASQLKISDKSRRRYILIVEETICMLKEVTGKENIKISFIEDEKEIKVRLETDAFMNMELRDELLSLSKSGKNESSKGIMGKIREAFELAYMMPTSNPEDVWRTYGSPAMVKGMPGSPMEMMDIMFWSLDSYKNKIVEDDEEERVEEWDELEKSIVANVTEDVRIGIKANHVVMEAILKNE